MAHDSQHLTPGQRRIVSWIRKAHRAGQPLNITAVQRARPDLLKEAFSIRPFWGWKRALEAAGCSYDKIAWHLEETVACEICGLERASLTVHLLKQHGLAAGEYQHEFPHAFVQSESLRAANRRGGRLIMPHWEPLWTPEYVLDRLSHFHGQQVPVNSRAGIDNEPSLRAKADRYYGSWSAALVAAGIDPGEVRLYAEAQFLDPDEVEERIRDRQAKQQPLNPEAMAANEGALYRAGMKHFGSWRKALRAAGVSPPEVLKSQRYTGDDEERLLRRAKRVAGLSGEEHTREFERLCKDARSVVVKRYGGWQSLAARLGVPARKLRRRGIYSKAESLEQLLRRQKEGDSLGAGKICSEDSSLYKAVILYFGTFEECYEELGLPLPPTPTTFRKAEQDPERLLEQIREKIPEGSLPKALSVGDLPGLSRLASISRKHFGSWEEGLARAGLMERPGIAVYFYVHPKSVRRDLERVASGELFGEERAEALFRHAAKLYGSVLDGLLEVGLDREAALRRRTSTEEPYSSGQRVCEEIRRRRRSEVPMSHGAVQGGTYKDLPLLRSAKRIFGSWRSARQAAEEPDARAERRGSGDSGDR